MPDSFRRRELLTWLEPFHVGSGRQPAAEEMNQVRTLIRALATENPIPNVAAAFSCIAGMWKCIFTTSRFVLGLDHLRIARLSAVYQNVVVHPGGQTGHYFNIAEMSRGGRSEPYAVNMRAFSHPALNPAGWMCNISGSTSRYVSFRHMKARRAYPTPLKLIAFPEAFASLFASQVGSRSSILTSAYVSFAATREACL